MRSITASRWRRRWARARSRARWPWTTRSASNTVRKHSCDQPRGPEGPHYEGRLLQRRRNDRRLLRDVPDLLDLELLENQIRDDHGDGATAAAVAVQQPLARGVEDVSEC